MDPLSISVSCHDSLFEIDHDVVQEILSRPVHTASGHAAIYRYSPTKIMKFSNPHEVQVYENIKHFEDVKGIVPSYYGFVDLPKGELRDHYTTNRKVRPNTFRDLKDHCVFVVMEDLLSNITSQCRVADIKLGTLNVEPDARESKKLKHMKRARETGMDVFGGRFDGLAIHGQPDLHKKELWTHTFSDNLIYFLIPECNYKFDETVINNMTSVRKDHVISICKILIEKLSKVLEIIEERHSHFNFLQSSIFIVYEGDTQKAPYADARLIDFDHTHFHCVNSNTVVTPYVELAADFDIGDAGVATGLKSSIKVIKELLAKFI